MYQRSAKINRPQVAAGVSRLLEELVYTFAKDLLRQLDQRLDRRLVETFFGLMLALLVHRQGMHGLLLSEMGGWLVGAQAAQAGTKRLKKLLYSAKWQAALVTDFLWQYADHHLTTLQESGETSLVIWDESVLEKSESLKVEGLSPVRSAKAARLARIKPGFFNPPLDRPIFVPGFHWLAILVMGAQGAPQLAHVTFWRTRGAGATDKRSVELPLLDQLAQRWGRQVLHVWDRGFAGAPWLEAAVAANVRFVVRWTKTYHLVDAFGQPQTAGQILRRYRSKSHQLVWDARRREWRKTGLVMVPVAHPKVAGLFWLIASRPGQGRKPWYLLTNEPLQTLDDAWRIVFGYARRWQVELALRFEKAELGMASPRLQKWETLCKLWQILALVYAFLLRLLDWRFHRVCDWLLQFGCPRTGKWRQLVLTPLYRLVEALSVLWQTHPPPWLQRLNSG
jgi:hypothetical protein